MRKQDQLIPKARIATHGTAKNTDFVLYNGIRLTQDYTGTNYCEVET